MTLNVIQLAFLFSCSHSTHVIPHMLFTVLQHWVGSKTLSERHFSGHVRNGVQPRIFFSDLRRKDKTVLPTVLWWGSKCVLLSTITIQIEISFPPLESSQRLNYTMHAVFMFYLLWQLKITPFDATRVVKSVVCIRCNRSPDQIIFTISHDICTFTLEFGDMSGDEVARNSPQSAASVALQKIYSFYDGWSLLSYQNTHLVIFIHSIVKKSDGMTLRIVYRISYNFTSLSLWYLHNM